MKWLRWTLLGVLGVLLLLAVTLAWMLNTASGTRAALQLAQNALGGKLHIARSEGTFAGPLTLHRLEFADPAGGTRIAIQWLRIDARLHELLRTTVHVENAEVRGVRIDIRPSNEPEERHKPFSLEPPIDIVVDRFVASDVDVLNVGQPTVQIRKAAVGARWTSAGIAVEQLDLLSPQGEVHFAANVRSQGLGNDVYVGNGRGTFRWRAGDYEYRGVLNAEAKDENARLTLNLARPVRAHLLASVKQTQALPWTFSLKVPTFDPRAQLLPDSNLQLLGAALQGAGSLNAGQVTGTLLVDGERLHVRPLHFTRNERRLDIDTTLRINDAPGSLRAVGHVRTDRDPARIEAKADWQDLVVPEKWAGQVLHTRGNLQFARNAQEFTTQARLALGPPKQMADISLRANGTPEVIRLQQLDVVEAAGRLHAQGTVDLKPNLGWALQAQANQFDPGAFAPAWKGHLNFALASRGEITSAGPNATVALNDLQGELRGRRLSGRADLQLTPNKVLAGDLNLRSGHSTLQVDSERGQAMNALIRINVASLNDWLPDANGRIDGSYRITGRWPDLHIVGTTAAKDVFIADTRVGAASVNVDITRPTEPSGEARLDAQEIAAAGFTFQRISLSASGNLAAHRVALQSVGTPLDAELTVEGALKDGTWFGTLKSLMLDVERAAHLTLREPARIVYSPDGTQISQTCLHDAQVQLCAAADLRQDGSLQAKYSLHDVPLALANALAPTLPLALEGTLQGEGDVRRDVDGALHGRATITSPTGQIAQRVDDQSNERQTLLRYSDLRVAANLAGANASANVHVGLEQGGHIDGELAANGLSEAVTPIRGQIAAGLPTLAPVALFVPQLANLSGSVDSRLSIAGTTQAPRLAGYVRANDVAADVPMLGLKLRNGTLEVLPREDGSVRLAGGVHSGEGDLRFDGDATTAGTIDLRVRGEKFLAADMPSANVIVEPNLQFHRAPDGMKLNGEVNIPRAKVNLQKLPRGGKKVQKTSSDVVVIDERTTEQETASVPLEANVAVILGDRVELTGFGLEARVDGRLGVREVPGAPTSGSGEIRIQGTYKAYGQDLTIQQGQVLYAGTPLDNPRLNIVAVREIQDSDVTAGLRITGSAQTPQLAVFSDPEMGEANALAYLVTGRPLDQLGTGGEGDRDMLQSAAESLGSAAGGLLAKKIGKRLGVDELSVKESEALGGGSALTVGEYLSPRLFLSYGVGLFEPGDVITLRYKLSRKLALQAERGPSDTRAGVQWRTER